MVPRFAALIIGRSKTCPNSTGKTNSVSRVSGSAIGGGVTEFRRGSVGQGNLP
jgi:hypothetical protein